MSKVPAPRPYPEAARTQLIELRRKKYPGMMQRDFATEVLGISRLHMTAVEMGRLRPSLDLALRWIDALAPEANIDMFGPLPVVERRFDDLKKLQKAYPELFKAA